MENSVFVFYRLVITFILVITTRLSSLEAENKNEKRKRDLGWNIPEMRGINLQISTGATRLVKTLVKLPRNEQLNDEEIAQAKKLMLNYFPRKQLKFVDVIQFGHTTLCYERKREIYVGQLNHCGKELEREVGQDIAVLMNIGVKKNRLYVTMWHRSPGGKSE
jgi:hypothetical protein